MMMKLPTGCRCLNHQISANCASIAPILPALPSLLIYPEFPDSSIPVVMSQVRRAVFKSEIRHSSHVKNPIPLSRLFVLCRPIYCIPHLLTVLATKKLFIIIWYVIVIAVLALCYSIHYMYIELPFNTRLYLLLLSINHIINLFK